MLTGLISWQTVTFMIGLWRITAKSRLAIRIAVLSFAQMETVTAHADLAVRALIVRRAKHLIP